MKIIECIVFFIAGWLITSLFGLSVSLLIILIWLIWDHFVSTSTHSTGKTRNDE